MGNTSLQIWAWAIGMVPPLVLASGLLFGLHKTIAVLATLFTLCAVALIVWWLLEVDYWIHAPLPNVSETDYRDNDGEIRSLFLLGAALLPVVIPSLLAGPVSLFFAARRSNWRGIVDV